MLKRTLGSTSSNSINSDARALAGAAPNQGASTGENGQRIQVGSGGNGPVNDGNFDPQTTQSGDVQPLVRRAKPNNYANDPAANVMVSLQAQGPIQDLSPHALLELKQKFLEACFNGDVGKIHAMLTGRNSQDKKALIFLTGFRSSTALMAAARGGHVGAMDVLLGALNEQERKELIFEKRLGRSTSLSDPGFFGFFDRGPAENALMAAAKGGHVGAMDVLLGALNEQDKKTLIIEKGSGGVTALRLAAQNGHMAVVQALLQVPIEPADINHADQHRRSALMGAAQNGHTAVVQALLQVLTEPADINDADLYRQAALMLAAENGHMAVVQALLQVLTEPADINHTDHVGRTTLMLAAKNGHTAVVQALLQVLTEPADINHGDRDGRTTLMLAAKNGHTAVVQALLQVLTEPADINHADRVGRTALMRAAENGHTAVVKVLLQVLTEPADINHTDRGGRTTLMRAAENGHTAVVQALLKVLKTPEDINHADQYGCTALMRAAENGHTAVVQALLQVLTEPADINHADHDGRTALMLAAELGHNEMAVAILDRLAQLGRPPEPNFLTDVDRSMIEIAGWNVHIEALLGWLPSGADSDNKLSEPDRKELIDIFLSAYKRNAHSPLPYAKYGLEDADSLLLELAIEKGQPGALNTWLRQNRVVTPEEIHRTMAAWRINHQAVDAVAGLPSPKNDVHITAMHDWDYLTKFFIEEVVQRIGSKDADRSAGA